MLAKQQRTAKVVAEQRRMPAQPQSQFQNDLKERFYEYHA